MNVPARGGVNRTTNVRSGSIIGASALTAAAPPVHAVVVAVELDAVPVERRRFSQAIDHGDLDGLPAPQHDRRAGCGWDTSRRRRRNAVAAQHESERRLGRSSDRSS